MKMSVHDQSKDLNKCRIGENTLMLVAAAYSSRPLGADGNSARSLERRTARVDTDHYHVPV